MAKIYDFFVVFLFLKRLPWTWLLLFFTRIYISNQPETLRNATTPKLRISLPWGYVQFVFLEIPIHLSVILYPWIKYKRDSRNAIFFDLYISHAINYQNIYLLIVCADLVLMAYLFSHRFQRNDAWVARKTYNSINIS